MEKDPLRSFGYIARDVALCVAMFALAANIDRLVNSGFYGYIPVAAWWHVKVLKTALWLTYWWWQSLVFCSFFCIGELDHPHPVHGRDELISDIQRTR